MNRGNRREATFVDDASRTEFLRLVSIVPRRFGVLIHGFALMPNHYHLMAECQRPALSAAMGFIQGEYTRWLNDQRNQTGILWKGRFHDRIVQDDAYWRHLAVYLHENPVKGRLVDHPDAAKWTSHRVYAGLDPSPAWLTTHEVASLFGSCEDYRRYVFDCRRRLIEPPPGFDAEALWDPAEPPESAGERALELAEALAQIEAVTGLTAMSALSDRRRATWVALEWLPRATGCSVREAATALGVEPSNASRARRRAESLHGKDAEIDRWSTLLDALLRK